MNKLLITLLIIWGLSGCASPSNEQWKLDIVKNQQDIELIRAEFDAHKELQRQILQDRGNTIDWMDGRIKILESALRVTKSAGVVEPPATFMDIKRSMMIEIHKWQHLVEQADILIQQGEMHEQGTEGELPKQEGQESRDGRTTPLWYWTYTGRD